MSRQSAPSCFDDLPADATAQREACAALFGRDLFDIRRRVLHACQHRCEDETARLELAQLFRQPYDEVARLPLEARTAARGLAQDVLDRFIVQLLGRLGHEGYEHMLDSIHALRYRVELEFVDTRTDESVLRSRVGGEGCRHLPNYWGRWLNAFGNLGDANKD